MLNRTFWFAVGYTEVTRITEEQAGTIPYYAQNQVSSGPRK